MFTQVGTQIQRHRVGFMQNCTRNYTMEKVDGKPEESKGKEECHVLDMQRETVLVLNNNQFQFSFKLLVATCILKMYRFSIRTALPVLSAVTKERFKNKIVEL